MHPLQATRPQANACTSNTHRAWPGSAANQQHQHHYLTIEELKVTLNSCWLCGCNWQADHVSLDCPECGGYALSRPCPNCDGKCQRTWSRNITATHDTHRAAWVGQCALAGPKLAAGPGAGCLPKTRRATTLRPGEAGAFPSSSSCCSSQPPSTASSDSEE